MDYQNFLKTDYWKMVSEQVKQKAHYKCQVCGCTDKPLHAHHNTYEHKGEEYLHLEDLVCLCEECHQFFHKKQDFKKEYNEMKALVKQFKDERDYAEWKLKNFYESRKEKDLSIDASFHLFEDTDFLDTARKIANDTK